MPIKASSARQIEALIADLASDRADTREAAVARLTVIGARAVDRLLLVLESDASSAARAAALRALEAIADARALDGVLEAIDCARPGSRFRRHVGGAGVSSRLAGRDGRRSV